MKNYYTLLALFFIAAWSLQAQPTCEDPDVLINDDIESYAAGDVSMQAAHWGVWPGATIGGIVTDEFAFASLQSIKVDGNESGQDVLLLLDEKTSGHYLLQFRLYVPSGKNAYFNLQHEMPTASAGFWGFDAFFDDGGLGTLDLFGEETTFTFPHDAWFKVHILVDIDADHARLIVNQYTIDSWAFSNGITNGGASFPSNKLSALNFYPLDEDYLFYIDNVQYWEIPPAGLRQYCYTATELPGPGFYGVAAMSCFGAGYDLSGTDGAFAGRWYYYTPTEDGILSISSCGGGVDTRGWIFSGDCLNLKTVGVNDDQCELIAGSTDNWASYREAVVTAGTTYYIMWDDLWEAGAFTFELGFTTTPPEPGEFCESAIPVGPGEYEILEITGNACVGGPNINNTVSSTTSYAQAKWYAFTPTVDGYMTISSCDFAASDTYVLVYTGDCSSFEDLTLVARNDDGCPQFPGSNASRLDSVVVAAGTTYFIEWIDRFDDEPFIWELSFDPAQAASTVKFSVNMALETVDPAGVFIAGSFSNFNNLPMSDANGDGVYEAELLLNNNTQYTYKFKNGPEGWENVDTSIGDNCTTGDFGDRFVDVGETALALDEVCFGFCVSCNAVDVTEADLTAAVDLFPNPTSGLINLRYSFETAVTQLDIRLIDALGRQSKHLRLNHVQEGTQEISLEGLPTGAYLLQLIADGASISRTIVVR